MYIFILFFTFSVTALAESTIWVNMNPEPIEFESYVLNEGDISIADYYLSFYQKKSLDQRLLLEKIDFFSKMKLPASSLDKEVQNLQSSYIFSTDNRLLLFEYLKIDGVPTKSHCHLYANDTSLKNSEPFFEANCGLTRVSLFSINSNLAKFDYMLIDGNKIDLSSAPYFFTSGEAHQFIFISNRFQNKEITATVSKLKKMEISLVPWIEGQCDSDIKSNISVSEPVKIYFSKDCVQQLHPSASPSFAFINRNKYYILSGLLITLAALYASSQYELGVGLP